MQASRRQATDAPRLALAGWAAATLAVIGLIGPAWGPALVPARAAFHLGLVAAGGVLLIFGLARTSGALVSAALSDRAARPRLVAAYGLLLILGLVGIALAPGWGGVEAAAAAVGFAFGAVTTEANAVAALAGGRSGGRTVSTVNAIYSAACAVSPLVVGLLVESRWGWRAAFLLWAVAAVPAFWGLTRAVGGLPQTIAGDRRVGPFWMGDRHLVALAAMSFLYTGVGWTVSGWAVTYLVGHFGVALLAGTLGSALYYACLAVGRMVNAPLVGRLSPTALLRWESALSALALLGLALAPGVGAALAAFAVAGFCLAGIYPNLIAQGLALRPGQPGAMAGVVATGGAAGAALVPFGAAAVARVAGLGSMSWLLAALGFALLALALCALGRGTSPLPAAAQVRRTGTTG